MSLSIPLFHAELLLNIRSITVSINLPAPSDARTKLTLPTPSQLQLYHHNKTTLFNLPANVVSPSSLPGVTPGETVLSYRLPVAPELPSLSSTAENYVPWSAISLSSANKKVTLHCRACSLELVNGEKVSSWKDLPSGNWADMMDFWHCHKPETEGTKGGSEGGKYAGLQGGYKTVMGTILVDLTYFLVAEGDCAGLQVVESIPNLESLEVFLRIFWWCEGGGIFGLYGAIIAPLKRFFSFDASWFHHTVFFRFGHVWECYEVSTKKGHESLCCSNCKAILGHVDIDGDNSVRGWRLNKWKIKLRFDANGMCEEYSYPMEPFLSAKLLAFAEGEGIRRMIISCDDDGNNDDDKGATRLKLWLFNNDVRYTNSQISRPIRALKVFYKEVQDDGGGAGIEQGTSLGNRGFEDVRLATDIVVGLKMLLEKSTDGLLEELKGFRGWRVGTLQRFEPENRVVGG